MRKNLTKKKLNKKKRRKTTRTSYKWTNNKIGIKLKTKHKQQIYILKQVSENDYEKYSEKQIL